MTGIELIGQERKEHITKHARFLEDDVAYNDKYQLVQAAALLVLPFELEIDGETCLEEREDFLEEVPEGWNKKAWQKMLLKPYRERLIIAGSLIAAELDRLTEIDRRKTEEFIDE